MKPNDTFVRVAHRKRFKRRMHLPFVGVVTVTPTEASVICSYTAAVVLFLETNDASHLKPFRGRSITDTAGRRHHLEANANALHQLARTADEPFETTYQVNFLTDGETK